MKKILGVIAFLIIISIQFVEAKDDGTIEHIGNDITLTHDGESITLYDKTLDGATEKCPVGYHIGSAEDYSNMIKLWYDIKGKNYTWLNLKQKDFYEIEESLDIITYCGGDHRGGGSRAGGDKDCIESLIWESDKLGLPQRRSDFDISMKKNGAGQYASYKTSSKGINNAPYIFVYSTYDDMNYIYNYTLNLKTCSKNSYLSCDNVNLIRCFKNDENTVINNGFSKEYNEAYIFAYNNQITTMPTIEQANMTGEIIRAEIAKMLSNWVKKFGYYANPNIPCNFTDTASIKGDLATAIIESCRYGIMGQGITEFRPYDKITRAEAATAVSRILRGTQYNGGNPFYINHVNALKNAGILTDNSNINSNELRGNVMLILMKANDIASDILIDCESSEFVLMCINDGEKCPEKCKNN